MESEEYVFIDEKWVDIIGYEGIYQVSNFGRIKSLKRTFIKRKKGGGEMPVSMPESIRSKRLTSNGYIKIALWYNGKVKHYLVHRLVAFYFVPNPNKYKQVLHLDNNPSNARWDNLKWGTQKMNIQQAVTEGRWHIGSKNNKTKLKESDIPKIRKLVSEKVPSRVIGEKFNVGHSAILSIKNNKTWSHIK